MNRERIEAALARATDTDVIEIGRGAVESVGPIFARLFPGKAARIFADGNTFDVAGTNAQDSLTEAGVTTVEPVVFPAKPAVYADYKTVEAAAASVRENGAIPVAVGSGTINDIVKLASSMCERRYMVVGTAASMDGYTAFGASISRDGYKQTFSCPAPVAVVADLSVLTEAPAAMTASGYADLLGKVTAGADWIIADTLGAEPIDREAWSLVQDSLADWTDKPEALAAGEPEAMGKLIEGLILTGLAMQANRNSRPASGSEHQFSHLWEMRHLEKPGLWLSHGFKVGLGSVAVAAMYERLLARELGSLDVEALVSQRPGRESLAKSIQAEHELPILQEKGVEESLAKYADERTLRARLTTVSESWPELKAKLKEQLLPAEEIRERLERAGCPVEPEDIGLTREELKASYRGAQQIRRRYTMLDLAVECGVFDECVEELFEPGGHWRKER